MDKKRRQFLFSKQAPHSSSLPWNRNETQFYEQCTRCNACLNACETQIIKTNAFGYPSIQFTQGEGECTFCYACANACHLPLFLKKEEEPWQRTIKIKQTCLSFNHIECRICHDICDKETITFKPQLGGGTILLKEENCTGCGACISICPVNAIELISN